MVWARAALVGGLLVLLAAFAVGTEHRSSASLDGLAQDCGPAISAAWLMPGTPDLTQPGSSASADERRTAAACKPVVTESRAWLGSVMGLGCLAALVGGSAIAARGEVVPRRVAPAGV